MSSKAPLALSAFASIALHACASSPLDSKTKDLVIKGIGRISTACLLIAQSPDVRSSQALSDDGSATAVKLAHGSLCRVSNTDARLLRGQDNIHWSFDVNANPQQVCVHNITPDKQWHYCVTLSTAPDTLMLRILCLN